MRKLFLGAFALAFGFAASDAHAAYFYWKVAQEAGGYEFSYASLYDYATETTFNVGDSATAFAVGADASGISTLTTSAKLDDGIGSGNSFFVRLFADDGTVVANSTVFGYDDIVEKHVYADLGTSADGRGYAVSSFVGAIPEPASGCLFLLGLAALALRRKRGEVEV